LLPGGDTKNKKKTLLQVATGCDAERTIFGFSTLETPL
jgi:hypothetical protein